MTVMTREQEAVFRELVLLADGDSDLVWRAIRRHADANGIAPLEKVVEDIKNEVRARRFEQTGSHQRHAVV
jgi:hypothetical protein